MERSVFYEGEAVRICITKEVGSPPSQSRRNKHCISYTWTLRPESIALNKVLEKLMMRVVPKLRHDLNVRIDYIRPNTHSIRVRVYYPRRVITFPPNSTPESRFKHLPKVNVSVARKME